MNRRLISLTLAVSFAASSTIFAQGNLLDSASRAIRAVEREQGLIGDTNARTTVPNQPLAMRLEPAHQQAQQGQGAPVLSKSKMSNRTKTLIMLAIGLGFAGSAYEIDRHVLDVTPSHIGTRQDGCSVPVFGC